MAVPFPPVAAITYASVAQTVSVYSVVEIGPNLLAAITSIIGACVLLAQLYLGRKVSQVQDTAKEAKDTAQKVEEVVELRKEDRGFDARRGGD